MERALKVLIIEDEKPAVRRMLQLIQEIAPEMQVLATLDSVIGTATWLQAHSAPDLIFSDIQLADGMSFEIFRQVPVLSPVIFTTAYNQYTLKAFKLNSIDYLLKPIDPEELKNSIDKFKRLRQPIHPERLHQLFQHLSPKHYKERFLVRTGQQLQYIPTNEIAYFHSADGLIRLRHQNGKKYTVNYSLEQLQNSLDPSYFFRINRQLIIRLEAIQAIHPYFNSRLKLDLSPTPESDIIVSRDRVSEFKAWLDR